MNAESTAAARGPRRVWDVVWVRGIGRLLSWVLVGPILAYQRVVSPLLPASCRYHPSCSEYARQALLVHGPAKGLMLGTARLARCNPFSGGGLDPVPLRGAWRPEVLPDGSPRRPGGA